MYQPSRSGRSIFRKSFFILFLIPAIVFLNASSIDPDWQNVQKLKAECLALAAQLKADGYKLRNHVVRIVTSDLFRSPRVRSGVSP